MRSLLRRSVQLLALAAALLLASAGAATADEPGESDESRVLVQQAIALIVNTGDVMAVEERIEDALKAPITKDADLAKVEDAMTALEAGDLRRTRELLQTAIGAGPYAGEGVPPKVRETSGEPGEPAFAVGGETGTTVVLDELEPGRNLDGGDTVLLSLSVLLVAAGALLAWRFRPADTVHQMRGLSTTARGT